MRQLPGKVKRQLLFIIVAVIAITIRAIIFIFWLDSPFRYYSTVGGLDMKTLLEMGTLFYQGNNTFALYNLLIAGIMQFNNGIISVTALIVIQQLMGVATCLLTAWICLKFTSKKTMACAAGIIAALYAPALIYEIITLRETMFVFTATLALAALIKLHQKRFSPVWLLLTGIIITLPLTVRISALLWLVIAIFYIQLLMFNKLRQQTNSVKLAINKMLKKTAILLSGVLLVIISIAALNLKSSGAVTPVSQRYIKYIVTMGRQENPKTVNIHVPDQVAPEGILPLRGGASQNAYQKKTGLRKLEPNTGSTTTTVNNKSLEGWAYLSNNLQKFGKLFSQYEIPNNINYYFMREHLFPCGALPGPGIIIPLAIVGLIMLIARRRFMHRELLLLLYILAFTIPITIFLPLARYRLILYPLFSIVMLYPFQLILCYLSILKKVDGETEEQKRRREETVIRRKGTEKQKREREETGNESEILPSNNRQSRKILAGMKICGIVLLTGTIYIFTLPEHTKFRASDFTTHGKAFQHQEGDTANTENCFAAAYQLNPISPAVAINYTDILLKNGKTKQALQAIIPAWQQHPQHSGVALFTSSALLCNGMPKQAVAVLLKAGEPSAVSGRRLYYYNLSESYRMQGKHQQAKQAYSKFKKQ